MPNKRRRIKPRGTVERGNEVMREPASREIENVSIRAWHPGHHAQQPAEQVHLILQIQGASLPQALRFKSPDTLGFLIEELMEYRRQVWPDCEPITGERK